MSVRLSVIRAKAALVMPKVSAEYLLAKKRHILDAASHCFARNGIRATTIQQICTESGLSAGAIYRYFDGKDAIVDAVFALQREQQAEREAQIAAAPNPLNALRHMVQQMFYFLEDPQFAKDHRMSLMVHAESMRNPALAKAYTHLHRGSSQQVAEIIAKAQSRGEVDTTIDPTYLAWLMVALYQGFRVHKLLDPNLDTARFTATAATMFDRMLGLDDASDDSSE